MHLTTIRALTPRKDRQKTDIVDRRQDESSSTLTSGDDQSGSQIQPWDPFQVWKKMIKR